MALTPSSPPGAIGYGTTVRIGRGATPTWTEVELVGDISMPEDQIDEIEVTHMKSPGRRRQYIAGLIDSGECTVPINYVPGNPTDKLVEELRSSGEMVLVEIKLPGLPGGTAPAAEVYAGFITGYSRDIPVNDKMSAEITFRLNERVS